MIVSMETSDVDVHIASTKIRIDLLIQVHELLCMPVRS